MSTARERRALDLFARVVDMSDAERRAALDAECDGDSQLRAEVDALLSCDAHSWSLFERPLGGSSLDVGGLDSSAHERAARSGKPASPDEPLGVELGRYRLLRQIGAGGMGVVYLAEQDHPRRNVAIKTLRLDVATRRIRARFQNEARTLSRLKHPGIAQIFDAGAAAAALGEVAYIAMEFVDGPTLAEFVATRTPPLRARLDLFLRLCDAVEHAHQRGVIHRDLKPANILIERIGASAEAQPKILDFGIARLLGDESAPGTLMTLDGTLLGTLAYMSPEQVAGHSDDVDTRSDVYALGVILFELLTGHLPFAVEGRPMLEVLSDIRDRPPPALARFTPGLDTDLESIAGKALAKTKRDRYASAAALAEDLRRSLAHEPILARTASFRYVTAKFARRHRVAVGAALAVGAAVLLGLGTAAYGLLRAQREAAERERLLESATEAVSEISKQVIPKLENALGASEPRRALIDVLMRYEDSLERGGSDDARLITARADLITSVSTLKLAEGRLDETLADRKEALELRRQLFDQGPDDEERAWQLSIALVLLGDTYGARAGNDETTEALYRRALDVQQAAYARFPDSERLREALIWSHIRLGNLVLHNRPTEIVGEHAQRAAALARQLADATADQSAAFDALQGSEDLLAAWHEECNRFEAGREHRWARVANARELVRASPNSPHARSTLIGALMSTAGAELTFYDSCDSAAALTDEAMTSIQLLMRNEPENLDWRCWYGGALRMQADVAELRGQSADAIAFARAAREATRDLPRANSAHYFNIAREIAFTSIHCARAFPHLMDPAAALREWMNDAECAAIVTDDEYVFTKYVEDLIQSSTDDHRLHGLALAEHRAATRPDASWRAWATLGFARRSFGEPASALAAYRRALSLAPSGRIVAKLRAEIESLERINSAESSAAASPVPHDQ
ncbi:MAG: serine/threonine-protein kinase [Phycisphaerae bacterium]